MRLGFPLGVTSPLANRKSPALALTYAQAFASSVSVLRNWFELNTGPRVPLSSVVTGDQTIAVQADADALVGKLVRGRILITGNNIELMDFGVEWDGSGTGATLIQTILGASTINIHHFLLDGKNGNISYGISGTSYSTAVTVTNGEIRRMGGDGFRTHKNSTYRHLYCHSFRNWNTSADGVFDDQGSQSLYPHTDACQVFRSGNVVEECWLSSSSAVNGTSGVIVKSDTDETIDGFTLRRCYVEGGGFPIYIDNELSDIDNPGTFGQPVNITLQDLRIGRNYRTAVYRHSEVPTTSIAKSNVKFADTGVAVPDLYVDDFNRANSNLEALTNRWVRVSGAAGALTVDTNRVRSVSTTQSTYLLHTDVAPTSLDHYAQAAWRASTSATGWLIIRYVDENNYVGMQLLTVLPTLYRRVGGTFTVMGATSAYAVGDKIRIEAEGQTLRMYRNGTLAVTNTLPEGVLTSGTGVGLQARTTVVNPLCDNFIAGSLPGYSN